MKPSANLPWRPVPTTALLPFTPTTFAISWCTLGMYIFYPETASIWFGEISGMHPAFVLAVWAPAFAAFAVVLYFGGIQGARGFLARLGLWRCTVGWTSFLLLGIPLVFAAGTAVKGTLLTASLPLDTLGAAMGVMVFMLFLGPVDDFGVIVTPLFNASRGSILLPALFHFQVNNPLWPDAQPYDTYFFVGVAVLVVWINRRTMLTCDGAVTEVFASDNQARSSP